MCRVGAHPSNQPLPAPDRARRRCCWRASVLLRPSWSCSCTAPLECRCMAARCLGLAAWKQPADPAEAAPAPRLPTRQGDALAVEYLHDVAAQLQLRRLSDGALLHELALPGLGSVREFNGRREDSEAFFAYTDFVTPGSFYRCSRAGLLRACLTPAYTMRAPHAAGALPLPCGCPYADLRPSSDYYPNCFHPYR